MGKAKKVARDAVAQAKAERETAKDKPVVAPVIHTLTRRK